MNIHSKYSLDIWIGLVNIQSTKSRNPILKNAEKGYVNVLALANNKSDYRKKVREALAEMNMKVIRMEGVEPLRERVQHYKVDKIIIAESKNLLKGGERIRFSTFHTYDD